MLPLKDDNPTYIKPMVTWALMAACVLVFVWQVSLPEMEGRRVIVALGAIPAALFQRVALPDHIAMLPPALELMTLVTSMFLHGGWGHLLGNMLYLWIFGDNVEDAMCHGRFVIFYLVCGIVAVLVNAVPDPSSTIPTVGASGAISGVLGAYVILYPRANVLVWSGILWFTFRLPAWMVLGVWFLMQIFNLTGGGASNVAWWAHIGGLVCGAALIPFFKSRHVGLFGDGHLSQTAPVRRGPWG